MALGLISCGQLDPSSSLLSNDMASFCGQKVAANRVACKFYLTCSLPAMRAECRLAREVTEIP